VVKIPPIANLQNVSGNPRRHQDISAQNEHLRTKKSQPHNFAHLVLRLAQANAQQNQKSKIFQPHRQFYKV
jgi:hypothetical protein